MTDPNLYNVVLKKAMTLCAEREMCCGDIRKKLSGWGLNENEHVSIIERLIKDKFIDENRYSAAFVKDKFKYLKWGKVKIGAALRIKGIPDEIIREALGSIDEDEYLEAVRSIIAVHRKKIKAKNQYDLKGKLLRFGLSRGFESHLLYDLLNEPDSCQ